jgi:hypothetical protein
MVQKSMAWFRVWSGLPTLERHGRVLDSFCTGVVYICFDRKPLVVESQAPWSEECVAVALL